MEFTLEGSRRSSINVIEFRFMVAEDGKNQLRATQFENTNDVLLTHNKMGYSILEPNPYSEEFIRTAAKSDYPNLDVGCAFGVATIPALKAGAKIIANDLSESHLRELKAKVPPSLLKNLTLKCADIRKLSLEENSLSNIHASQLLHFFTGTEIEQIIEKFFHSLVPGGKVFIIVGTPYVNMLEEFLPLYEKRKSEGKKWPGEIDNFLDYCPRDIVQNNPPFIHFLEKGILESVFKKQRFIIERSEYYQRLDLPKHVRFDGRENVGLIASKPL